jgi:putative ABC transport system permease protein
VGVAADTRYRELTRAWLTVYFPARQFFFFSPGAVVARTAMDSTTPLAEMRRTIEAEEPAAAVHSVDTMEKLAADEIARPRTAVAVATLFALTAIVVAAMACTVCSRSTSHSARELAVHSAVGASPAQILGRTIRQSLTLGALGAVSGLGVAALVTRHLATLLFEIQPLDAASFAAAGCGLLAIVVAASLSPARRAAAVDPVVLLRSD